MSVSVSMKLTQKQTGALYMKCVALENKLKEAKESYVKLTNSVEFLDNGEPVYVANKELMGEFDKLFGRKG